MVKRRETIKIDERLCTGCEQCVRGCHGGALAIVNGKARLVNDDYCDGLGACIGVCPSGAITVESCDDSRNPAGGRHEEVSRDSDIPGGGMRMELPVDTQRAKEHADAEHMSPTQPQSQLTHWPVQLHLIGHSSEYYVGADLLVAADCSAYACADFHESILKGRKLVIACPKLDNNKEVYTQKLKSLIDNAMVSTITVAIMNVPCCSALLQITKSAVGRSIRKVPIKRVLISVKGEIVSEEWL